MSLKMFLKKNSSTILSCVGAVGVVATAVTAVKATPKALELIEERKTELEVEKIPVGEIVKTSWKCYIPSIAIGLSTITCIFGANVLNKRSQAALISAYSLLDSSFKEYKEYTNELYGEDADEKIREAIAKDKYSKLPFKVTEEKQLFYDMISGRYFESTLMEMYRAEYELNRGYAKYGYVCLNDFYDLIGVDRVEGGYDVVWSVDAGDMFDGYDCREFEHELVLLEDGLECYVLITPFPPTADYLC